MRARLEKKDRKLEATFRRSLPRLINEYAQAGEQQSAAVLSNQLRIAYLEKLARERSPMGRAAQRVLAMTFVQLSRTADELTASRSERATSIRQVAQEIPR